MEVQNLNVQTGQNQGVPAQTPPDGDFQRVESAKAVAAVKQSQGDGERARADEDAEREEVPKVIEGINSVLANSGSHVQFVEHKASQRLMVQILDNRTNEVIRTIPSKELLDLAAKIGEMIGVLVDRKT